MCGGYCVNIKRENYFCIVDQLRVKILEICKIILHCVLKALEVNNLYINYCR